MLDSITVIYGLVFAAALLLMEGLIRLFVNAKRKNKDVSNRLEALKLKEGSETAYTNLLLRRGITDGANRSFFGKLRHYYGQSGIEASATRITTYFVIGITVFFFLIDYLLPVTLVVGFILAILVNIFLVAVIVFVVRQRRIKKFTEQLAPAIDIIVRSLNAGHPLNAAISLVAKEMPDPVGSEFGVLTDQITFGSEMDDALLNMYDRVGAPEINLLTVTITVQQGTGGSMSEVLENLAQMIRDRLMIRAKIRAISAEGRITAWIMMAFPFFLFTLIRSMVPDYFDLVWESGWGGTLVAICIGFMIFGFLIVRKLVNFDF